MSNSTPRRTEAPRTRPFHHARVRADAPQQGNAAFSRDDFAGAVQLYSNAIEKEGLPGNPIYFINRAQANLKMHR